MHIGLVLHADHRERFAEAARTLTGVDFTWAIYEHEDEISSRVAGLLDDRLDGLLLGLVPYARSRDLIPADLPVAVTRSAALDLALAWAKALRNGWPATPVSIDTFDQATVDEVARALGLDPTGIATLPFDPDQTVDDVVAFHRQHSGSPYVISVRTSVAAALSGQTAVLHALATPGTIRADLHELALRAQHRRANAQRFAAGIFALDGTDVDRALVGLQHLLVNTPEFADAWIDPRGRQELLVFAPAALFEAATHQWVTLPVLAEARTGLGVRVVAGFGIGGTARQSVTLAERAATRAGQDAQPGAYLFTDSGMTIGPMGASGTPLTYTYREHGGLEALAGRVGLSPATLSRLAAVERTLAGKPLSPSDLARTLGITDPSGRRLIRKLDEARLIVREGSTQVSRKGRPTRLYRLAITPALESVTSDPPARS
ncbi:winged helix-turn-helix domain-containing protein [Actinoplanes sp. NPDC051343]|uniref:winged helix-turn-helix domain-containing protein n=1 Tax=Actinoplanes sp. NPDC051343 TaxID=3363906 RepID=UPI00379D8449